MNMIQCAKQQITELIGKAYAAAAEKGELPEGVALPGRVEIPKDPANGAYAANDALAGTKAIRLPPRQGAENMPAHPHSSGRKASCLS